MNLVLDVRTPEELDSTPHLHELIGICHAINSINYVLDQMLTIHHEDDSPRAKRGRIYGMIQLSSFTYEAMKLASPLLIA